MFFKTQFYNCENCENFWETEETVLWTVLFFLTISDEYGRKQTRSLL